jgi:hypothetical protein
MTRKQLAEQAAETSKRKAVETLVLAQRELQQQESVGSATAMMADVATPTPLSEQLQQQAPPPPSPKSADHEERSHPPSIAGFAQSLMSMGQSPVSHSPSETQRLRLPEVTPSTGCTTFAAATGVARMHSPPEHRPSSMMFEDASSLEPLPGFVLASTFDNDAKPRASSFDTDGKPRASSFDNDAKPRATGAFLEDDIGEDDAYRALSDHDFGPPIPTYEEESTLNDYDDET